MNSNIDTVSENIRHTLHTLFEAGDVVELRLVKTRQKTIRGYFDNLEALVDRATDLDKSADATEAEGIYVTLNRVDSALLSRCANRTEPFAELTTSDRDIVRRRWLLVDCDPRRPAGISSTEREHTTALQYANEVVRWLVDVYGWPQAILADSGNGAHLLFRVDLQNDAESKRLVEAVLAALDFRFGSKEISIDTAVGNASRIIKLYGTVARKGDNTPERPHRKSKLLHTPSTVGIVSIDQLKAVAEIIPIPEAASKAPRSGTFDLRSWMHDHNVPVGAEQPWNGGSKWIFEQCPFNHDHKRTACIVMFSNGAIAASCRHNSCAPHKWPDFREVYEPNAYAYRNGEVRTHSQFGAPREAGTTVYEPDEPNPDRKVELIKGRAAAIAQAVEIMNAKCAYIEDGKFYIVVTKDLDNPAQVKVNPHSYAQLLHTFAPARVRYVVRDGDGKSKRKVLRNIVTYWDTSKNRRSYQTIRMNRSLSGAESEQRRIYNLWRGYAVERIRRTPKVALRHFKLRVCAGNTELYRHLVLTMACFVQRPERRIRCATVLMSKTEGIGKGLFVDYFKRMLGRFVVHVKTKAQMKSQFNMEFAYAALVYFDECLFGGDKATAQDVKGKITEKTAWFEGKGKDRIEMPYMPWHIIAGNEDHLVHVGLGDRRYFVIHGLERAMTQREIDEVVADIEGDGPAMLLDFLIRIKIPETFNPDKFPDSTERWDLKLASSLPIVRFIYQWLNDGAVYQKVRDRESGIESMEEERWRAGHIDKGEIIRAFAEFCDREKITHERSLTTGAQWREFYRLTGAEVGRQPRVGEKRGPKQPRLPSQHEARKAFDSAVGGGVVWTESARDDDALTDRKPVDSKNACPFDAHH